MDAPISTADLPQATKLVALRVATSNSNLQVVQELLLDETVRKAIMAGASDCTFSSPLADCWHPSVHGAAAAGHGHVLLSAVGDLSTVDSPEDLSTADRTVVHAAGASTHAGLLQALLAPNASTQAVDACGRAVLYAAAAAGCEAEVRLLLAAGVKPDGATAGMRPLHAAAAGRHVGVLRALLMAGADPQAVVRGRTALHIAAAAGNEDALRALLEAGANPNTVSSDGFSCFRPSGFTALHMAAGQGHAGACRVLLASGAEVDVSGSVDPHILAERGGVQGGLTALHYAVKANSVETAAVLLAAGAGLGARTSIGRTPLHFAARFSPVSDASMTKLLLAAGASHAATDIDGATPLLLAADQGCLASVKELLAAKADVNAACDGWTPLFVAVECGRPQVLQELLQAGAHRYAADSSGVASTRRETLHVAAQDGNAVGVQALLDHTKQFIDVPAANAHDSPLTPLQLAAWFGRHEAVAVLLQAGAAVDAAPAAYTCSPLQFAVEQGHLLVVQQLIEAGADVNADAASTVEDPNHGKLLDLAVFCSTVEVVEALQAAGARTATLYQFGHDALEYAVDAQDMAMLQAVLSHETHPPSLAVLTKAAAAALDVSYQHRLVSTISPERVAPFCEISAALQLALYKAVQQEVGDPGPALTAVFEDEDLVAAGGCDRDANSLALLKG